MRPIHQQRPRQLDRFWRAATAIGLIVCALAAPAGAQTVSTPAAALTALAPATQTPLAPSARAPLAKVRVCDPANPDCPAAKQALSDALERRSQIAQAPPAAAPPPPAPAAAPAPPPAGAAFGGLANAAAAKADENSIRFGLIAPFTGANKDFAGELKLGAETAFAAANDAGGVNGKYLRLVVADDGYDPEKTPGLAKMLVEQSHVFGFLGNFGSATAASILPYVLEHKLPFFGAFSGAGLLRQQPPDRYVFNYRPSYAEEAEAAVKYLVRVRHFKPSQIAVFAQDDAFGDAGYLGVEKAMRALDEDASGTILHMRYTRNTIDVAAAMEDLRKRHDQVTTSLTKVRERVAGEATPHLRTVRSVEPGVKAVVMVATYRAAAKFIEKARDLYPDMVFTNVSAVGSNNFAEELKLLGPRYANGIVVTQIVPDPAGFSSIALEFKAALAKYFPAEHPDYVSFESYINAKIVLEGLRKAGPQPDSDKFVNALESIHGLDFGLGPTINYGSSEHQAIHKIWGSQLDEQGHYHFIDLE